MHILAPWVVIGRSSIILTSLGGRLVVPSTSLEAWTDG
jgi:hypothetical protein